MNSALQPLEAARRWNSSSFAAVAVHWLCPPLAERRQCAEQLLRVARVGADVVVPEHDRTGRAPRDLAHDLVDRAVAHGARPIQERDRAVVAPVRAAAGGDRDRLSVVAPLDQVPARRRLSVQAGAVGRAVEALEPSGPRVLEQVRPGVPGLEDARTDRKSTRLNSSHITRSYAVFGVKKIRTGGN